MAYPAQTIANYLIWRVNSDEEYGEKITNLKMQKLLYYAQGFHLAWRGMQLFDESIEAWAHGPVVPDVYYEYRDNGSRPIPTPDDFDPESIDVETQTVLEEVYSVYGQFSAWGLRNLTHEEAPWKDTPRNGVISPDAMHEYFVENLVNA